ncbi:MAG: translocation/assembly module TamB [Spirochaetia bacterium]|nr:translocation/assembly module TamB [Spirochaetia bacterium]
MKMNKSSLYLVIIILTLVFTSIIISIPLQNVIKNKLSQFQNQFLGKIERSYGVTFEYDSISPSFINSLKIKNFRILQDSSNEELIFIDEIILNYKLSNILFKPRTLGQVEFEAENIISLVDQNYLENIISQNLKVEEQPELISDLVLNGTVDTFTFISTFKTFTLTSNFHDINLLYNRKEEHLHVTAAETDSHLNVLDYAVLQNLDNLERYADVVNRVEKNEVDEFSVKTDKLLIFEYINNTYSIETESVSFILDNAFSVVQLPINIKIEKNRILSSILDENFSLLLNLNFSTDNLSLNFSTDSLFSMHNFNLRGLHSIFPVLNSIEPVDDLRIETSINIFLNDENSETFDVSYKALLQAPYYPFLNSKDGAEDITASFSGDRHTVTFSQLQADFQKYSLSYKGDFSLDTLNPDGSIHLELPENSLAEEVDFSIQAFQDEKRKIIFSLLTPDFFNYSGNLDYSQLETIKIISNLDLYGCTYHMPFTINISDKRIQTQDNADVHFSMIYSDSEKSIIETEWNKTKFPLRELGLGLPNYESSGKLEFAFNSLSEWDMNIKELQVVNVPILGEEYDPIDSLTLQAHITPNYIDIKKIAYNDTLSLIEGDGSVNYSFIDKDIYGVYLDLEEEGEKYAFNLTKENNFINSQVIIKNGNFERIPMLGGKGTFSGDINILGSSNNLNYGFDFQIPELVLNETVFKGNIKGKFDNNSLTINTSNLYINRFQFEKINMTYDFSSGKADTSMDFGIEFVENSLQTRLTANTILSRIESPIELMNVSNIFNNSSFTVKTDSVVIGDFSLSENNDFIASIREKKLLIKGINKNSFSGIVDLENKNLLFNLNKIHPLSATFSGSWKGEGLDLFFEDIKFDVDFLNTFVPEELHFKNGIIKGFLSISGNIKDPDFYGELFSDSIIMSNSFIETEAQAQNMYATVHGKNIDFSRFNTIISDVPVQTELSMSIEKWIPSLFSVEFSIPKGKSIRSSYTFDTMKLTYAGSASGKLGLEFNLDTREIAVNGNILADNMEVTQTSKQASSIPFEENLERNVVVDLRLTTGKSVSFILPTKELPILKANAQPQQTLDIKFNSRTNTYEVVGSLDIKSGEIYYFKRNFYITSGNIDFFESENKFDPVVNLEAQLKEFDRNANKVDIILKVNNQYLSKLSPIITSRPVMELNEIAQILGTNILSSSNISSGSVSSAVAIATLASDIVQQLGIIDQLDVFNNFENKIRNTLNLDVFSIRTQILENVLVDVFPGESPIYTADNPIGKYLDNTTVLLGKYISDSMFLQTMLQFNVNDSVNDGLFMTDALKMDVEFSFDWQNPLYDFTISTTPDLSSITGILSNTSIGLSWNYSF